MGSRLLFSRKFLSPVAEIFECSEIQISEFLGEHKYLFKGVKRSRYPTPPAGGSLQAGFCYP
jgi:hypothetical protein